MAAPTIYAIDFGTSNSLLAAADPREVYPPVPLDPAAREPTVLRSILYFSESCDWFFGQGALDEYVAQGMRGRFMRSVKRFLPVESFVDTRIGTRRVRLDELIGVFLRVMRQRANEHFGTDVRRVLLGRPARFSDDPRHDQLAQDRLESAARFAGFEDVAFCPEPVAAAYDFRRQADAAVTVLVADLGGGTSDFTVARLLPEGGLDVLAIGGISIAGDALDGTIMRGTVAPHLGADVTYKVPLGGNVLTMPRQLVDRLCSPAELCLLARRDVMDFLRSVQSWSLGEDDKRHMEQLLCLIEDALGFRMFEAVEATKRTLSDAERARFVFDYPGIDIQADVLRSEFEAGAQPLVSKLMERLDATLEAAGIGADQIDVVCATGGTARVPLVRKELETRFGAAKLHQLSSFHSVILGLAQRARALA